jgi:hypothetical protein
MRTGEPWPTEADQERSAQCDVGRRTAVLCLNHDRLSYVTRHCGCSMRRIAALGARRTFVRYGALFSGNKIPASTSGRGDDLAAGATDRMKPPSRRAWRRHHRPEGRVEGAGSARSRCDARTVAAVGGRRPVSAVTGDLRWSRTIAAVVAHRRDRGDYAGRTVRPETAECIRGCHRWRTRPRSWA